jgi:hypothetical protein
LANGARGFPAPTLAFVPRRMNHSIMVLVVWVLLGTAGYGNDWPQWLGPQRDAIWTETGILDKFPADGPSVRWRTKIGGGYAGPAVAGGRVYVTDRLLPESRSNPKDPFDRGKIPGTERVLCLDETNGQILWKHEYDCPYDLSYPAGPRATPVVHDGKVYTLGAIGHLFCLDAESGKVVWSRELKKDYGIETPLWGFAAHPLIDGQKLICLVGGEGSTAVAFDKDSGQEIWRALKAKEPGYCPPMIYEAGGKRQLIIWHPESINSLDPATGKLYWSDREGMRVMRANLDGSNIETLVDTSKGDARPGADLTKWCVGITVDPDRGQIYWTQKGPDDAGKGRIFRAKIDIPKGETAANRTDIELLFDGLPEPIDLELDLKNRLLYWTDRGDPPRGNTVNRASIDADFSKHPTPDILLTHLMEGIGIALDFKGNRMFITDLAGNIFTAKLDGSEKKPLLVAQGNLTGIAYAEVS